MQNIDIDEIRNTPIEEVAEKLGIEVVRHTALCPFHDDKHPSLHFDLKRNRFKCFSCGASGDVISLVERFKKVGFKEAVRSIQSPRLTSPTLPPGGDGGGLRGGCVGLCLDLEYLSTLIAHPVINEEAAHFLYEERKIDPRVVRWCGLTSISVPTPCWRWGRAFYDAPSLLIPYRDVDGRLLTVQGRRLSSLQSSPGGGTKNAPRFRFPRGSRVAMYNKPVIGRLKAGDELWITEGPSDCWAMMSAGRKAVAIPSATSLTQDDIRLLRDGLPEGVSLHMFPDNDAPGMLLFEGLKRWFPQLQGHVLPDCCKDFGEAWVKTVKTGPAAKLRGAEAPALKGNDLRHLTLTISTGCTFCSSNGAD